MKKYRESSRYIYFRVGVLINAQFVNLTPPIKRHRQLHQLWRTNKANFYCIFKKDKLHKFDQLFSEFVETNPEFSGQGESINVEVLQELCDSKRETFLIIAYSIEDVYLLHPLLIRKFCEKHGLKRTQTTKCEITKGQFDQTRETTYCIPFNPAFFNPLREWLQDQKTKKHGV